MFSRAVLCLVACLCVLFAFVSPASAQIREFNPCNAYYCSLSGAGNMAECVIDLRGIRGLVRLRHEDVLHA